MKKQYLVQQGYMEEIYTPTFVASDGWWYGSKEEAQAHYDRINLESDWKTERQTRGHSPQGIHDFAKQLEIWNVPEDPETEDAEYIETIAFSSYGYNNWKED